MTVLALLRRSRDWSNQELAEFYRVEASLARAGVPIDTDRGLSDEGDPWFVFCREDSGDVIIHFARFDGQYVVASPAHDTCVHGRDFRAIITALLDGEPLVIPAGRDGVKLFMHPAALMAALVTTCFFKLFHADAAAGELAAPAQGADGARAASRGPGVTGSDDRAGVALVAMAAAAFAAQVGEQAAAPVRAFPEFALAASPSAPDAVPLDGMPWLERRHLSDQPSSSNASGPAPAPLDLQATLAPTAGAATRDPGHGDAGGEDGPGGFGRDRGHSDAVVAAVGLEGVTLVEGTAASAPAPAAAETYPSLESKAAGSGAPALPQPTPAPSEAAQELAHILDALPPGAVPSGGAAPAFLIAALQSNDLIIPPAASPNLKAAELVWPGPGLSGPGAGLAGTGAALGDAADDAIRDFIADHSDFGFLMVGTEVIIYDSHLTPSNMAYAVEETFVFDDGSSVVLVGLAACATAVLA